MSLPRYVRAHFGLDALDACETAPDDPARLVTNPARLDAKRAERDARRSLHVAAAAEGRAAVEGLGVDDELRAAFADAGAEIDRLAAAVRAIPAESALARLIAPHYARAENEAHTLLGRSSRRQQTSRSTTGRSTFASMP